MFCGFGAGDGWSEDGWVGHGWLLGFRSSFKRKSFTTKGTKVHEGKFARVFPFLLDQFLDLENDFLVSINLLPERITPAGCGRIRREENFGKRYTLAGRKSPLLAREARSGAPRYGWQSGYFRWK
jgi:hypothetical protein